MHSSTRFARLAIVTSLLLPMGCGGKSTRTSGFLASDGGAGDDSGATFLNPDGASSFGDAQAEASANTNCPMETQYVYALAESNVLYRFDPPTLTFTSLGAVNCPDPSGPFSMAVDRKGTAWIAYQDGRLFYLDTTNAASCTPTQYALNQHGFLNFGMGFSSDTSGGEAETLFVTDDTALLQGLAHIDLGALVLNPVGPYDTVKARGELTGTGDGRLFGAFDGTPFLVAEIDKTTAKILSQAPQAAIPYPPESSNFAFAFWGGDFWLFVGPGTSTDVFQYKPSTQTTTKVASEPFEIVGAGVSTCAPTKPPQ